MLEFPTKTSGVFTISTDGVLTTFVSMGCVKGGSADAAVASSESNKSVYRI
jgi:hypothetical protein